LKKIVLQGFFILKKIEISIIYKSHNKKFSKWSNTTSLNAKKKQVTRPLKGVISKDEKISISRINETALGP
jgi:hypothetical protein